jgi:beta-glucosidase
VADRHNYELMKNKLKVLLKAIGVLLLLLVLAGFLGYLYFNSTFIDFEDEYAEKYDFPELTKDNYTFLDRNGNGELDDYEDDRLSVSTRVSDVLSLMTQEEKIHLLKGSGLASAMGSGVEGAGIPGAVGTIVPTPRLGIPTIYLSDGPAGLRIQPTREGEDRTYYCTAFPIATLLASTWNEELVYDVGNAMGNEALQYGIDVILGPGANIHRHPLCGRNFEYFSEDPLLTGFMGAAIVNGIESNGVGTSVKHFVANNQETKRNSNDVLVSERAMREIYLKGFEIVVEKAQPWTIMSSYNKVNGTYTSESKYLLTDVLRGDWGFEGLVMTDWFGGKDAVAQINAGNDLLEPGTKKQWDALIAGAEDKSLSKAAIDTSAGRILTLIFNTKKMQDYRFENNPDLVAHANTTRKSASEGMVLLKNDNTLPLSNTKNIALLGTTSYAFIAGGTGSGDVNEAYTVSLEQGLTNAGFEINKVAKRIFEVQKAANKEAYIAPEGIDAMFTPFVPPAIAYTTEQLMEITATSDVGIFTIGRNAGEGGDRLELDDFLLTTLEQETITAISTAFQQADKKFIVVLNIGGVIETQSWKTKPDAILLAWQGGQEGGNSVVDILSGKVNPSGKLPMTFPIDLNDHASNANFPLDGEGLSLVGLMTGLIAPPDEKPATEKLRNKDYTAYDEGIYVGYRHFDKAKTEVSYPFGYGLSYTNFEYSNSTVIVENDTINVSLTVKNSGNLAGKEIVQVYTEKLASSIDRPAQELKSFAKTRNLKAGATDSISIRIPVSELQYWDIKQNNWALEKGVYRINVGASSRDIKLTGKVKI